MYFRVTVKILTTNVVVDLNSKTINIIKKKMLHCSKLTAQMNLFLLDAFWFEFPFRFCFTTTGSISLLVDILSARASSVQLKIA